MKNIAAVLVTLLALTPCAYGADASVSDSKVVPADAKVQPATDAKVVVADAGKLPVAATKPTTPDDVLKTGKGIWDAFKGGRYREAVALIIVMLMWVWRRFLSGLIIGKLSKWWLGLVTALLSFLGTIPGALLDSPFSWSSFIWTGLITSAEAMFLWQMVIKKIPIFQIPETKKAETTAPADSGGV